LPGELGQPGVHLAPVVTAQHDREIAPVDRRPSLEPSRRIAVGQGLLGPVEHLVDLAPVVR
jgi:hypothetical protein